MVGAALVGLGWWGKHIVNCLQGAGEKLRLVRAVDVRPDAVAEFAAAHGLEVTDALEDVLADPAVEAVILATPHSQHEGQIVRVAEAGKHVFSEKPLALTKASAARAIDACERAGVQLGVGHERRYEPAMVRIRRLVEEGALGTLMHVESNFSHDLLAEVTPGDWRASAVDSPAAGMTSMGIHLTDAYICMFGEVDEVFAQTAKRVGASASGDVISVQLRFASGLTGYLNAILVTPFFMRFHVYGTQRWIEARDTMHPQDSGVTVVTECAHGGTPVETRLEGVDTVRMNLEAFADAVRGRAPYPFTSAQKLHNIAVLEAIIRSARSNQVVRVG